MMKNICNVFLCMLAVVSLNGCMRYAPSIGPSDALVPSQGYVYGRFSRESGANLGATQMGVVVVSVDKNREIAMRFEQDLDPYAVGVDPGDYQVTHFVQTQSADNHAIGKSPFPGELSGRVIRVEAGKAYYIGDYDGAMKSTFMVLFIGHEWGISKITNDFAGTTAKLDALLPQMKNLPKVDVFGDALVRAFSLTGASKADASSSTTPVLIPRAK
jgi:hypothetical protein